MSDDTVTSRLRWYYEVEEYEKGKPIYAENPILQQAYINRYGAHEWKDIDIVYEDKDFERFNG